MEIKITDRIKEVCPKAALGCVVADVSVEPSCEGLLATLEECCDKLSQSMVIEDIVKQQAIIDSREVYKKLGKAPSKYRVSSEALMRRILQGKGVYKINNVVEINNIISIKSGFSVGSYNLGNIEGPVYLAVGEEGEKYKGIGKYLINISNLPVLKDSVDTFGSPTSDSERAMITDKAEKILMCMYAFSGKEGIEAYLEEAKELLEKYASASNVEIFVVE